MVFVNFWYSKMNKDFPIGEYIHNYAGKKNKSAPGMLVNICEVFRISY